MVWSNAPHPYAMPMRPNTISSFTMGPPPIPTPGAPRPPKRHTSFVPVGTWRRTGGSLDFQNTLPKPADSAKPKRRRTSVSTPSVLNLNKPHAFLPTINLTSPTGASMSIPTLTLNAPRRTRAVALPPTPIDDLDDFLSSDLDLELQQTFASASISSPPQHQLYLEPESSSAMDISPEKARHAPIQYNLSEYAKPRPRSYTTTAGMMPLRDVSNNHGSLLNVPQQPRKASSGSITGRKLARPTIPMQWFSNPEPEAPQPASPASDMMMDVDTSFHVPSAPESSPPLSAAPTIASFRPAETWVPSVAAAATIPAYHDLSSPAGPTRTTGIVHVFSPGEASPAPKKMRRSISPGGHPRRRSDEFELTSPSRDRDREFDSPMDRGLRRMKSSSLLAQFQAEAAQPSSPAPTSGFNLIPAPTLTSALAPAKRLRKPAPSGHLAPPITESISANPRHSAHGINAPSARLAAPPARRAVSAMGPPPGMSLFVDEGPSSSFENSMELSPAQAVVRRQQLRTLRRCDGAEDLRLSESPAAAIGGRFTATLSASPTPAYHPPQAVTESPSARYMVSSGIPGFGDNEAMGKVLPCHRVKEDGLMRITPTTLNMLLAGEFDGGIVEYRVIDCRFEYEYSGGHIPGAINLNTTAAVEELLLNRPKPNPSTSADTTKKTVLVFHCEFSAKRAPTFAKHLRAKDRSMNNHCYPKIHYPEVYVLEGGYCQYFKEFPNRCDPPAYVRMDDPTHAVSRKEDLDRFRRNKFGRTQSYAYGEGAGAAKLLSTMARPNREQHERDDTKRNTAPSGAPAVFAAGNMARTRRGPGAMAPPPVSRGVLRNGALGRLGEDGDTTAGEEDETDIGDSPCPPPTKTAGLGLKVKKLTRGPLLRSETCGPLRLGAC